MYKLFFQSAGKTEQGIPRYLHASSRPKPPLWLSLALLVLGLFTLLGIPKDIHKGMPYWDAAVVAFAAFGFGWPGYQLLRLRHRLRHLHSTNQICAQFQMDQVTLERIALTHGIKPRYNVNSDDFYNLADFGEMFTLLRASIEPTAQPETLLRPASESVETPPETLLRATHTTPSAQEAPTVAVRKG
jgi:hypothetical protein